MDNPDDFMEYLLEIGALEKIGYDEHTQQNVYRVTEMADEFIPEFTEYYFSELNTEVFFLWQNEYVDIIFDEEGEPMVTPLDKAYEEDTYKELSPESLFILKQILAIFEEADEDDDGWYNEDGDDY
jgi:hypothetical protein